MSQKDVNKSSPSFNDGYRNGYDEGDPISAFFRSFVPHDDDYEAGKAEGERDRYRDDKRKEN